MEQTAAAPKAPIVPPGLVIESSKTPGFRSPSEIAVGAPPCFVPIQGATTDKAPEKTAELEPAKPKRKPAAKKAKVERKPRTPPLPMAKRFEIMKIIEGKPTATDAALADDASAICDRAVSPGLIATYREQLGQKSIKEPSRAELRQRLAELERQLEKAKQAKLPLFTDSASTPRTLVSDLPPIEPPDNVAFTAGADRA